MNFFVEPLFPLFPLSIMNFQAQIILDTQRNSGIKLATETSSGKTKINIEKVGKFQTDLKMVRDFFKLTSSAK